MYLWHETHDAENAGRLEYQIALYFIETLFPSQYQKLYFYFQSSGIFEDIYIETYRQHVDPLFYLRYIRSLLPSSLYQTSPNSVLIKWYVRVYSNMNINHHNQQLPYIVQITYQGRLCFAFSHMSQKNQLNIALYDSYYALHTI